MDEDDDDDWEDEPAAECKSACRCGECCRKLILEAGLSDAEREPRLKECEGIDEGPEFTRSGRPELIGYMLNDKDKGYACHFLDLKTNLCEIYDTRPWMCRVFDCDKAKEE